MHNNSPDFIVLSLPKPNVKPTPFHAYKSSACPLQAAETVSEEGDRVTGSHQVCVDNQVNPKKELRLSFISNPR